MAAGEPCPVSTVDERVAWDRIGIFGGFGIGRGPAYPGLGRDAHLETTAQPRHPGWFASKVFWYVRPRYRGPVLVRGRRLDEQGPLGFAHEGEPSSELRLGRHDTVLWDGRPRGSRGEPTGMRVRGSGCYGAQIDGTNFSRAIVFTVSTE